MKLTLKQIDTMMKAFQSINMLTHDAVTDYRLMVVQRKLMPYAESYAIQRGNIERQYSEETPPNSGRYIIPSQNVKTFNETIAPLDNTQEEIDIEKIPYKEDMRFSPKTMLDLYDVLDFADMEAKIHGANPS